MPFRNWFFCPSTVKLSGVAYPSCSYSLFPYRIILYSVSLDDEHLGAHLKSLPFKILVTQPWVRPQLHNFNALLTLFSRVISQHKPLPWPTTAAVAACYCQKSEHEGTFAPLFLWLTDVLNVHDWFDHMHYSRVFPFLKINPYGF